MPADYGYINARVKGMKSRLLSEAEQYELIATRDLSSLFERLSNSPYGREIQEALSRTKGLQAFEEAMRRHLVSLTSKILAISEGRPRALLEIIVQRWDLVNLKTILRGKHSNKSEEEILSLLIPAGTMSEAILRELLKQETLRALSEVLATWGNPFFIPLKEGEAKYSKTRNLASLELSLDKFYFNQGLKVTQDGDVNSQMVREVLKTEIDGINIRTAFKLQKESIKNLRELDFFIEGGREITSKVFLSILQNPSLEQGLLALRKTSFRLTERPSDLHSLELFLERLLIKKFVQMYRWDPLTIGVVIGYLWMKYNELVNLRLIARGKLFQIPSDILVKELLFV